MAGPAMTTSWSADRGYLRDVLERLPIHLAKDTDDLLPHRWVPSNIGA